MTTLKQILRLIQKAAARYELVIWFEDKKCSHRGTDFANLIDWLRFYPESCDWQIVYRWTLVD